MLVEHVSHLVQEEEAQGLIEDLAILGRQLRPERNEERLGVRAELARDLGPRAPGIERRLLGPGEEGDRMLGGHEERHQL